MWYSRKNSRLHTKLLGPINEFSKAEGYNMNIHRSAAFLYNNNEY